LYIVFSSDHEIFRRAVQCNTQSSEKYTTAKSKADKRIFGNGVCKRNNLPRHLQRKNSYRYMLMIIWSWKPMQH